MKGTGLQVLAVVVWGFLSSTHAADRKGSGEFNVTGGDGSKPVTLTPNSTAQKIWETERAKKAAEADAVEARKAQAVKAELANRAMIGDTEDQLKEKFREQGPKVGDSAMYYATNCDIIVVFSQGKAAAITWDKSRSARKVDPFLPADALPLIAPSDTNLSAREISAILKDNQGVHGPFKEWKEAGTNQATCPTRDGELIAFRPGPSEIIIITKSYADKVGSDRIAETEVPSEPTPDTSVPFKIGRIEAKTIDDLGDYSTVSWKATIQNNTADTGRHRVTCRFIDKDGFVLEESAIYDALLKPGRNEVTEKVFMKTALWKATTSFKASVRP